MHTLLTVTLALAGAVTFVGAGAATSLGVAASGTGPAVCDGGRRPRSSCPVAS